MSVQTGQDEQFTFVAGINSEAGYFTFPKNTWKDGDNLVPNVGGVLSRRKALDLESGYELSGLTLGSDARDIWAYTSHKWHSVGGNGDDNLIVQQVGRFVYFYLDTPIETSTQVVAGATIDLENYKCYGNLSIVGQHPIKAENANGRLIITSKDTDPIVISRTVKADDPLNDTFSVTEIDIRIRDFEGVDDGLATTEQPLTLSDTHRYNLYNQGWSDGLLALYFAYAGSYPNNVKTWHYGKNTNDDFDAQLLDKQDFGSSAAPKGRCIIGAFFQDRYAAALALPETSFVSPIDTVYSRFRPVACAFYAGRAWYAGVPDDRFGTNIYFSQVASSVDKFGKCYQEADPTSEVLSDVLDSDGGVIPIQDCGQVKDIVAHDNGILVFASNGVWAIVGTTQTGFSATGYEVKKLSSYGTISRSSIVDCDDFLLFWSYNSICKIGKEQSGVLSVTSITDLNIKSLYNALPALSKKYSSGTYNSSSRTVMWLYNHTLDTDSSVFPYRKTKALLLDLRIGAFYTYSFPTSLTLPCIADVTTTRETLNKLADYTVIDESGNNVVTATSDQVVAPLSVNYASERQFKFLTIVPKNGGGYGATLSDFLTTRDAPSKFYDWFSYNNVGVSYSSYVLTGYSFAPNGPSKAKQSLYITTYMERTETGFDGSYNPLNESSCLLQARWDFTDSGNANKWTPEQQVYRHKRMFIPSTVAFDDGYPVVIAKSKIRGRGKALQLKFSSEPDYDMRIAGWSVPVYGGNNV